MACNDVRSVRPVLPVLYDLVNHFPWRASLGSPCHCCSTALGGQKRLSQVRDTHHHISNVKCLGALGDVMIMNFGSLVSHSFSNSSCLSWYIACECSTHGRLCPSEGRILCPGIRGWGGPLVIECAIRLHEGKLTSSLMFMNLSANKNEWRWIMRTKLYSS